MAIAVYNLGNANLSASDPILDSKLYHRFRFRHYQTGTVATLTEESDPIRAAGQILNVKATITKAIPIGAATVTIDVKLSHGGGAFTSILTATISLTNAATLLVPVNGTINLPNIAAGDTLQVSVTATAGGGTLPQGLVVSVETQEQPS